jgi:leucyl-tRNA synthetase
MANNEHNRDTVYDFKSIENNWRKKWADSDHDLTDLDANDDRKSTYCLSMFSYPSGDKLHLGHWYNYVPADTWARFRRMCGDNVFQPVGFDSFGLPAENYAIKCGVHPHTHTEENICVIRDQLKTLGAMYDWRSELATHRPEYYKWTQWLFLQLYKNDLAYRDDSPVNWCTSCQTVLANEQVVDGYCERCDNSVESKKLTQWKFRITKYADRLIDDLEVLDWPEETKKKQLSWIGRSNGAEVNFIVPVESAHGDLPEDTEFDENGNIVLRVFTTRPDTLFGVTYMALAPEHPLSVHLTEKDKVSEVKKYIQDATKLSEVDRQGSDLKKTGIHTGTFAVNPVNGEEIPILIADYVIASYGTGAVMAVPAHDQRDFEFSIELNLPMKRVILGADQDSNLEMKEAWTEDGLMVNSSEYNGQQNRCAGEEIIVALSESNQGKQTIQYRLRDWLVSRQRYWGSPIPIIHCPKCGEVPVPEDQLPLELPSDVDYKPKGKSPLESSDSYMNVECPECGGDARRDSDTMDTFVCSSWYFLRYFKPNLDDSMFLKSDTLKWMPIEMYVGGADHAYGHLIFSRFITKVLHDLGYLGFEEPFKALRHQGMITRDGQKMSKSKGNTVVPADYLEDYGTDTLRTYLMKGFAFAEGGDWTDNGIEGIHKFLTRVWRLTHSALAHQPLGQDMGDGVPLISESEREKRWPKLRVVLHNSIMACTRDLERFQFNTAVSKLMELNNALREYSATDAVSLDDPYFKEALINLIQMLSPFAPHFGAELWDRVGGIGSVFDSSWPQHNDAYLVSDTVIYVIQINGKIREKMEASKSTPKDEIEKEAMTIGRIPELIGDNQIRKVIVVPGKLVNIVI